VITRWRSLAAILALLLVAAGCAADTTGAGPDDGDPVAELPGEWSGSIETPGVPLQVGVRFAEDEGTLDGTIDIPAEGVTGLPLGEVGVDGDTVSFSLPDIPGDPAFAGILTGAGDDAEITGEFTQAGRSFPFRLSPGTVAGRPQEPRPPFPYRSEEVTYRSGDVELAGTLTLPRQDEPVAAVHLVTGSGPQDRDATIFGHKPFLLLADTLTRAGYAVLRTDDRGVGGSGGDLDGASYDELAADAVAGVELLRARGEVDPGRVGLLGHSEGGYLAPLAAQRSDDVAFVVLLAAPAVPGEEVLVLQNRLLYESAGFPPEEVEAQLRFIRELAALLRAEDYDAARALAQERIQQQSQALPEAQRPTAEQVEEELTASRYLRSFVVHDPAPALAALQVPVFAGYGGRDLQVPPSQSEPAMRALLAGNPDATVETFAELNHLMQPAPTGSVEEYATIETTLAPELLERLTGWMDERF
jgi:pimeloyl-ACP methyl ester carboxylesterase